MLLTLSVDDITLVIKLPVIELQPSARVPPEGGRELRSDLTYCCRFRRIALTLGMVSQGGIDTVNYL
jgi:hypothetical protein